MGSIPRTPRIPRNSELLQLDADILIAGTGPVGCAFARRILDETKDMEYPPDVCMIDVGALDNFTIGGHQKNDLRYQKDSDSFTHVIDAALQKVSVTGETMSHSPYYNPKQDPEKNLPNCAMTRTVGGMGTHWTCACPRPRDDELENSPIKDELKTKWLGEAEALLGVRQNEYDDAARHRVVRGCLKPKFGERVQNLPLAVKRDSLDQQDAIVTFGGPNTILGDWAKPENCATDPNDIRGRRFWLFSEHQVVKLHQYLDEGGIAYAEVLDLRTQRTKQAWAWYFVMALGAIGTPQVFWNSNLESRLPALGRNLSEQSLLTCQVLLKKELQKAIDRDEPKPLANCEPQVNVVYTSNTPWNGMINRDAYLYGDYKSTLAYDPRFVVDLRFYGRHRINRENRVTFEKLKGDETDKDKVDLYGLPRATFEVTKSNEDREADHRMRIDMENIAFELGDYLPGSEPKWQPLGAALHVTGTTRLGENPTDSVANKFSVVHGLDNLYIGGNGVIPGATACNPTLTSVAYALKAAENLVKRYKTPYPWFEGERSKRSYSMAP